MRKIIEFLEILSIFLKIMFRPIIEIQKELEAIFINKHPLRSIFRIVIIVITGLLGIISSYYNKADFVFFLNICQLCKVPIEFQSLTSVFLTILTSSYVGTYISEVIARCVCKYLYGDPDFYLTRKRAIELVALFAEQGHCDITPDHIKNVFEFCRIKYRQAPSSELGAKPDDWKKTIESILYYADLKHFLDQYRAIEIKKAEIKEKIRTLKNYYLMTQENLPPGTRTAVCSHHHFELPSKFNQILIIRELYDHKNFFLSLLAKTNSSVNMLLFSNMGKKLCDDVWENIFEFVNESNKNIVKERYLNTLTMLNEQRKISNQNQIPKVPFRWINRIGRDIIEF